MSLSLRIVKVHQHKQKHNHKTAEAGGRQKGGNRMIINGIRNLIDAQKEKRKAELKKKAQDDIRALRERSYRLRKENAKPGEPVPKTFEEYLALSEKEFVEAAGKSYNTERKETL